jgi:hypothetical protein
MKLELYNFKLPQEMANSKIFSPRPNFLQRNRYFIRSGAQIVIIPDIAVTTVQVKFTLEQATRYSSALSLTSALDVGGWLAPCIGRFIPQNDPVPIV